MSLVIDTVSKIFDITLIKKGCLMYAKHRTWAEGKGGFVTAVKDTEITIQYHPGIGNVTNHFFLPVSEVTAGEWEVRWSEDLTTVSEFIVESGGGDES